MTQEEINDYNRMCAEFLGYEYISKDLHPQAYENYGWWVKGTYTNNIDARNNLNWKGFNSSLKFHSDWNWIMKIIEKILDVCLNLDSMEMYYNITDAIPEQHKVMQAINQFLIWYNNENNKR